MKIYCAECGKEIKDEDDVYVCLDNFLQVKYFENNELNRFCSHNCFCKYLSLSAMKKEEVPLDGDEQ